MRWFILLTVIHGVVSPSHPLMRLRKLARMSQEILTESFGFMRPRQMESWRLKFEKVSDRMTKNWERGSAKSKSECGSWGLRKRRRRSREGHSKVIKRSLRRLRREEEEEERLDWRAEIHGRFTRNKPCLGIGQITAGYSNWADKHIGHCGGQRNFRYLYHRMEKWRNILTTKLIMNGEVKCFLQAGGSPKGGPAGGPSGGIPPPSSRRPTNGKALPSSGGPSGGLAPAPSGRESNGLAPAPLQPPGSQFFAGGQVPPGGQLPPPATRTVLPMSGSNAPPALDSILEAPSYNSLPPAGLMPRPPAGSPAS